jgi:peptidoglycan/xylan/chitin deacetylase (PgdA/CDA1 family)
MSTIRTCLRLLARASLCAGALGGGIALARYTNIAREDLSLGLSRARAADASAQVVSRAVEVVPLEAVPLDTAKASAALELTAANGQDPMLALLEAIDRASAQGEAGHEPELHAEKVTGKRDGFLAQLKNGRIIRGATPHRLILFTFDDGPNRNTTPKLLDRLDAMGIHAVFFLTGSNLRGINVAERKNQAIARDAIARGHWVASHGMNHRQLPLLSDAEVMVELVEEEQVFERVFGQRPWLIRPPGGAMSARVNRLLASRGYTTVLWNLGAGDFQVNKAEDVHATWRAVMERREAQGERGGIVLLHDTYSWSVDAFQLIVNDLLARNCELLDKGEELFDFVDDPALFFEARGEASANVEAKPAVLTEAKLERRQARLREETRQRCSTMAAR